MMEFIKNYGFLVLGIVVELVSFIAICLKKAKVEVKDTPFAALLSKLPKFINIAEQIVGEKNGERKKHMAMAACYNFLCDLTGDSVEVIVREYGKRIDEAIEEILSTPEKKGKI